jgi:hypothetical protein
MTDIKKQVGARIAPELYRSLKVLAATTDRSIGDLLEEAIGDLLRKHRKGASRGQTSSR